MTARSDGAAPQQHHPTTVAVTTTMAWRELFREPAGGLDDIHHRLRGMLDIDRRTLGLGFSGLLGTTDGTILQERARRSDDRVDELARQIRRELVVHASVRGARTDVPAMLATMSIVKDVQRIGDHATALVRLARVHGHFAPQQPQHAQLIGYRKRLNVHLFAARDALRTRDPTIAGEQITQTMALTDELELAIDLLVVTAHDTADGTATAFAYRHLSRIAAHLTNVATSVALPIDQLDQHDGRIDRVARQPDAAT